VRAGAGATRPRAAQPSPPQPQIFPKPRSFRSLDRRACSYGSVWQNQRRRLGVFGSKSYSERNLLASTDRGGWTDRSGALAKRREALPRGMHWTVVRPGSSGGGGGRSNGQTDAEGWQYAFSFGASGDSWSATPGRMSWVRRREWVAVHSESAGSSIAAAAALMARSHHEAAILVLEVRQARLSQQVAAAGGGVGGGGQAERGKQPSERSLLLRAHVQFGEQAFSTEAVGAHDGGGPHDHSWFGGAAHDTLRCRAAFVVPPGLAAVAAAHAAAAAAAADGSPPPPPPHPHPHQEPLPATGQLRRVRVWTEEWVGVKVDRLSFEFADGSCRHYGREGAQLRGDSQGAIRVESAVLEAGEHLVSRPTRALPSRARSTLTGIYLCHAPVLVTKLENGNAWTGPRAVSGLLLTPPTHTHTTCVCVLFDWGSQPVQKARSVLAAKLRSRVVGPGACAGAAGRPLGTTHRATPPWWASAS
jgi:hypothetical protein